MSIERAKCTNCGGNLQVDSTKKTATCPFCHAEYLVQDAINNYKIVNEYNIQHVDTVINQDESSSTVQLRQMESCISVLKDYKKAEEIARAVIRVLPDSYEAYWGLIRIRTEDLTTCGLSQKLWDELDGYAQKVLALAPVAMGIKSKYQQQWNDFCRMRQALRNNAVAQNKNNVDRLEAQMAQLKEQEKARDDAIRKAEKLKNPFRFVFGAAGVIISIILLIKFWKKQGYSLDFSGYSTLKIIGEIIGLVVLIAVFLLVTGLITGILVFLGGQLSKLFNISEREKAYSMHDPSSEIYKLKKELEAANAALEKAKGN